MKNLTPIRQREYCSVVLVALLASCGAVASAQCCPGDIHGRVTDAAGKPIANATVFVHECNEPPDMHREMSGKSGIDGSYRIPQMMWGPCIVSVTAPGFVQLDEQHVRGPIDANLTLNETMVRETSIPTGPTGLDAPVVEQRGFVMDGTGSDLADTGIRLFRNGREMAHTKTDGATAFGFKGADGYYEVLVSHKGFQAYRRVLFFSAAAATTITLTRQSVIP